MKDKTGSRLRLQLKLDRIKIAKANAMPHPVYPGLEHAKLPRAQYKLVHIVNNFYFRMYATNAKVAVCKGVIHPTQFSVITELVWHCKDRAEAYVKIQEQLDMLLKQGYTWEQKLVIAEEIHDTEEFQKMLNNQERVNFDAANEKYRSFEDHIEIPEKPEKIPYGLGEGLLAQIENAHSYGTLTKEKIMEFIEQLRRA